MLPSPDCAFTIPSLHDGTELHGRLYFPRHAQQNNQTPIKALAIIAHPYAPLGGSMDDPVVQLICSRLLRSGVIVNTFNFRGAGGSSGSTSWTGNGELADYVSFVVHMLYFINSPHILSHLQTHLLILGGYSYGSMIASCLPDHESLRTYIDKHQSNSIIGDISLRAEELSQVFLGFAESRRQRRSTLEGHATPLSPRSIIMGGNDAENASQHNSGDSLRRSFEASPIRRSMEKMKQRLSTTSHTSQAEKTLPSVSEPLHMLLPKTVFLLVSPILPPISSFITMFSKPAFDTGNKNDANGTQRQQQNLSQNSTLILFGEQDMFTSPRKLAKWAHELQSLPHSKLVYKQIGEAGHFWREAPGVESLLQNEIMTWFDNLTKE